MLRLFGISWEIASLCYLEKWPKIREKCGNANSLQDKELARYINSFTVKGDSMRNEMGGSAENDFFGFVILYSIRNYPGCFEEGFELMT